MYRRYFATPTKRFTISESLYASIDLSEMYKMHNIGRLGDSNTVECSVRERKIHVTTRPTKLLALISFELHDARHFTDFDALKL